MSARTRRWRRASWRWPMIAGGAILGLLMVGSIPLPAALAFVIGLSSSGVGMSSTRADTSLPSAVASVSQSGGAAYFPLLMKHHERAIRPLGQIGGLPSAVALAGRYAYVAVGPKLVVLDVADPANVEMMGQSEPVPSMAANITVQDGFAYVFYAAFDGRPIPVLFQLGSALGSRASSAHATILARTAPGPAAPEQVDDLTLSQFGIHIYDVRDVRHPRLVGEHSGVGSFSDFAAGGPEMVVEDGRLFVLDHSNAPKGSAVRIIDVSSPAMPHEVGGIPRALVPGWVANLVVTSGTAFVVSIPDASQPGARLSAIDVRDPAAPKVVAAVDLRSRGPIARLGTHLFVADATSGLSVVDISDPSGMRIVAAPDRVVFGTADCRTVSIRGLSARSDGFLFGQWDCFAATEPADDLTGRLATIDVRDPLRPRKAAMLRVAVSAQSSRQAVSDRLATYVTHSDASLFLADIADPYRPLTLTPYRMTSSLRTFSAAVSATTLYSWDYAYGSPRLIALDIRVPEDPRVAWTAPRNAPLLSLATSGDALYLLEEGGLHVVDTQSGTEASETAYIPAHADESSLSDEVSGLAVSSDRLYLPETTDEEQGRPGGLRVFDVASDPLHPREIGSTPGSFTDVAVAGSLAWVASDVAPSQRPTGGGRAQDLQVFDVTDPAQIRPLASFAYPMTRNEVADIVVAGDEAFVRQGDQLFRHRLSRSPDRVSLVTVMDKVFGSVAIHDSTLFAHVNGRLTAFDIRQSPHPAALGAYDPRSGLFPLARDMVVGDDRLYIATAALGLWIFDIRDFSHAP